MRDAAEKAEAERRQPRLAKEGTSSVARGNREGQQGRGGRGGGRGTGRSDSDRFAGGQTSGHLSGSTIREDGGRKQKVARAGLRAGASDPSRSAARTKKDTAPTLERDGARNLVTRGGPTQNRAFIKEETLGPAFASSDGESDIAEGPRVNIEYINLISDDESVEEDSKELHQHQGGLMGSDKKAPDLGLKPIRVDRHEHVERAIGGTIDPSSLTSAELRRRAQERQEAEGSLFIPDDVPRTGLANAAKGKSKAKDVEFVRDERRWKGVYQDEEGDAEPRIKEEAHDDDSHMAIDHVEPVSSLADRCSPAVGDEITTPNVAANIGGPTYTEANNPRGSKSEPSKRLKVQKPVFQTEEDRQEWNRYEMELEFLREELGTTGLGLDHVATIPTATEEGANPATDESMIQPDGKEGQVYLFQLPPIAPQLLTVTENENRLKAQAERENDAAHASQAPKNSATTKSRTEPEDSLSDKRTTNAPDIATTTNPPCTPGKVGILRIYESGRAKIEWGNAGGASMELRRGFRSSMLQEVIMTSFERTTMKAKGGDEEGPKMKVEGSEKERGKDQEKEEEEEKINVGDTAWAIGELAGSFVMTPDWDKMFKR